MLIKSFGKFDMQAASLLYSLNYITQVSDLLSLNAQRLLVDMQLSYDFRKNRVIRKHQSGARQDVFRAAKGRIGSDNGAGRQMERFERRRIMSRLTPHRRSVRHLCRVDMASIDA